MPTRLRRVHSLLRQKIVRRMLFRQNSSGDVLRYLLLVVLEDELSRYLAA